MTTTTATQHRAQLPGRARPVAPVGRACSSERPASWRITSATRAFQGCDVTGDTKFPMNAQPAGITTPTGAMGLATIKRTARHLAPRST